MWVKPPDKELSSMELGFQEPMSLQWGLPFAPPQPLPPLPFCTQVPAYYAG